jgi:hypothetical protein
MLGVWGVEIGKLGDARVLLGMSGRRGCLRFEWIVEFSMLSLRFLRLIVEEDCRKYTLRLETGDFLV